MKGYRTLALNGAIVIGTAALTWLAGVNWTDYVSPSVALVITGGANLVLRLVTTTPVGSKD
jgi:hypothetical protein